MRYRPTLFILAYSILLTTAFFSMPTFIVFRSGSVIQTLRGADPRALTSAVENAVKFAGPAKPTFSTVGHTLGGPSARPRPSMQQPWAWKFNLWGFLMAIYNFIGLYLISLFSVSLSLLDLGLRAFSSE
jgi:thioredoxin 1